MILKGSQRSGGQNLAAHLMKIDDNEHITLHQLRGFASDDLRGAFKEIEAVSVGTKCQQYLFSLSLSPPANERVSVETFEASIDRIEERLGLEGQPRAIVFHEKEGRRHAHCVWSRIDAETMTAKPLPFFKRKLVGVSRDLYLENGWKMPRGIANAAERDPRNFSLAEWQQAKRQGVDPRWMKETIQGCWKGSDNLRSFQSSLMERGLFLAKGDKRGHVVLDHAGEVYSLPRMLDLKTKEVRARLGDGNDLRSVNAAKALIGERMTPAIRAHLAESKAQFQKRSSKLGEYKQEMTLLHREARNTLASRHDREWQAETRERAARLPKGLRGLWHRITGRYQDVRRENEVEARRSRERQDLERQRLVEKQLAQRAVLQAEYKKLRSAQAERLSELRKDIGRYLSFTHPERSGHRAREATLNLRLER